MSRRVVIKRKVQTNPDGPADFCRKMALLPTFREKPARSANQLIEIFDGIIHRCRQLVKEMDNAGK